MRWLAAISLVLLSGCAHLLSQWWPPVYPPRGPIHEVVAYYADGSWEFGTCFAVSAHTAITASHVVVRVGTLYPILPTRIEIDGNPASTLSYGAHDEKPALLFSLKEFTEYLPTGTAKSGPGSTSSIYGDDFGTVSADSRLYTIPGGETIPAEADLDAVVIPGASGSPLLQGGVAVGVLIAQDGPLVIFEAVNP